MTVKWSIAVSFPTTPHPPPKYEHDRMKFCFEGCCSLECCLWIAFFFWSRKENAKVALFFSIHCNRYFERRKLESEVYTLLFSLYNPQQKVTTYSSRKWIEAKHRNKSLRSLLITTRHFWLRANYLNDEIDSDVLAMMSPCMCGA